MYLAAMTSPLSDDELLAAVCPIIQKVGSAFYFTPESLARGAELGLDRGQWYFLGRGGVLGDVDASMVSSAFGYFNRAVVALMWNAGREKVAPSAAGAAFMEAAAEFGRARLAGIAGLDAFNASAEKVVAAADGDSLPLFVATAAMPLVDDAPGRAMQLLATLREFRGSAHLLAVRANGLTSKEAHFVSRPDDARMFGWSEQDVATVGDNHRTAMKAVEALTDRLVKPAYAVLDADERAAFVAVVQAVDAALAG